MGTDEPMVPPLLVSEDWAGDVTFYRTAADLLGHIEPWFPSTVDYYAYDSEGRRLKLVADPPVVRRRVIGPIWTDNAHQSELRVEAEPEPSHATEMAQLLLEWLRRLDALPSDVENLTPRQILDIAIERTGYR